MITAKDLIDKRNRTLRTIEEKRVVVTADKTVETCELDGRERLDIPRRYMFVLRYVMISPCQHKIRKQALTMWFAIPSNSCSKKGVGLLSGLSK